MSIQTFFRKLMATIQFGIEGPQGPPGTPGVNWRGAWNNTTAYVTGDVVQYNGGTFRALVDVASGGSAPTNGATWGAMALPGTDGLAGNPGPQGPAGPAGLNWRGAWINGGTYAVNDAVTYNGSSYRATTASTGVLPTDTSAWALVAAKGADAQSSSGIGTQFIAFLTGAMPEVALNPVANQTNELLDTNGNAAFRGYVNFTGAQSARLQGHINTAGALNDVLMAMWLDPTDDTWKPLGLESNGSTAGATLHLGQAGDIRGIDIIPSDEILAAGDALVSLFVIGGSAVGTPALGNLYLRVSSIAATSAVASAMHLTQTPGAFTALGQQQTASVTVTDADLRSVSPQPPVVFQSSDTSIFTVDPSSGVCTAVAPGTAVLLVRTADGTLTTSASLTVAPVVATVSVTPPAFTISDVASIQLFATGYDANGHPVTGTPAASWDSDNDSIAQVNSTGQVTGQSPGTVHISATINGITGIATGTLTAAPQTLDHIVLQLSDTSIVVGEPSPTSQLLAYQDSDETEPYTDTLNPAPSYNSDRTDIATITNTGTITMQGATGVVTFTVTAGGKSASAALVVSATAGSGTAGPGLIFFFTGSR